MSKLERLIQQYCPDGVEYVPLSSIGTIKRGNGLQKKDFVKAGIGCIHYGQIYTKFGLFTNKTLTYVDKELADHLLHIEKGDLVIACTSENVEDVCKAVAWLGDDSIVTGGHSCILHHNQNPKYIAYFFQTESFQRQKRKYAYGTKVIDIKPDSIGKIEIPLPPLPVQEEIVRVLDAFTELQAELQAELQKRKQQYNYYRDNLLSFKGRTDVEWKKLGEIASIKTGRRFVRTDIRESGVPCFHYGDIYTYYGLTATQTKGYLDKELAKKLRFAQPNDVVVVCAGENDMDIGVGVAWLGDKPAVVHDACCILHHNQSPRYISHFLRTHNYHLQMKKYVKNGKISSLPASGLAEALIPLPSFEEQKRIASILDRFDTLTTDLTKGLPAEIEKRRQQYEYYRDKLLTFKRKGA